MEKRRSMIHTLFHLKGNPRACVYTEPLWGIPYNLFTPYASLYMYAMGVKDSQIGLIATIGLAVQIVAALLSGVITDKFGRRKVTFAVDFLCWSVPCIIWAVAQNFTYFVVAAIINGAWRITANSWMCLMVEDSDQEQLVDIYAWVHISGLISAFFAPLAGLFVGRFGMVPTVRVLYILAFVMMTMKFIILYVFSTETRQGRIRMEETKNQSMVVLLSQYGQVFRQILQSPATLLTLGVMLVMNICNMVNSNFWPLFVTERLHIPAENVALFPFFRSTVMLIFYFVVIPKLSTLNFQRPMITGFGLFIVSQLILITIPENGYIFIVISTLLEAASLSLINPLMDSLSVINVDPHERARIMAIIYVIMIGLTTPFGWIAGTLSEINRVLPFLLNIVLFILGAVLVYSASAVAGKRMAAGNGSQLSQ